ncbi:ABC transporter ATP-binding protein [Syntrophomonas palmitatica]|uniref:ABC transporter ATP-binding protein n=1 Tax=Syntrophomonas palmitatica TaxID=402877 RepID=UPI001FA76BA0|nr:ABC transporter ATP-binding protein [Syntrophomonas palmitatica]
MSDISLQIREGEIFFLLGPNGCGKTTLLDCILGILKPRSGSIQLNNIDIKGMGPEIIARQIAYVPQSHEKTFPYTVRDIVLMGRAAYIGMFASPSRKDRDIVDEALDRVGILHLRDRRYTQLSGGEGQLVMIARALAQKTPLMVMDEPTAHLDFRHELVIMETIVDLVRKTGLSVIMASHFPNHCFYYENSNITTRVALMNNSKFLGTGCPTEILSEENLKKIYRVNAQVVSCMVANQEFRQVIPVSTAADI